MIDKTKAYRFRGDSERWEFLHAPGISQDYWSGDIAMPVALAEHLRSRGILIEYPELPGENWEFCEAKDQEMWWMEMKGCSGGWDTSHDNAPAEPDIYCRKKKPVITEVETVTILAPLGDGMSVWLPDGFAKPGDKVKVTKL